MLNEPLPGLPSAGVALIDHGAAPQPLGVHSGGVFFFPRIEIGEALDDNVFASDGGRHADLITRITPALDVRSSGDGGALALRSAVEIGRYAFNPSEDYSDVFSRANYRRELGDLVDGYAELEVDHEHEARDDPNFATGAAEPPIYNAYAFSIGVESAKRAFGYSGELKIARSEYGIAPAFNGGLVDETINNDTVYSVSPAVSYEIAPSTSAVLKETVAITTYDRTSGFNGFSNNRGSRSFLTQLGVSRDLDQIIGGEVLIGYLTDRYSSGRFQSFNAFNIAVDGHWRITSLTNLTAAVSRVPVDASNNTASAGASADLRTMAVFTVRHELRRDIELDARASFENDAYQGISRTDDRYGFGLSARFYWSEQLFFDAGYAFDHRSSTGRDRINPFSRDILMVSAGLRL